MLDRLKSFFGSLGDITKKTDLRIFIVISVVFLCAGGLMYRLFTLQIVHGAEYLNNFQLKIRRQISIPSTRGNIYDRNGKLLAYNELAYSVVLRDVGEESSHHDKDLNGIINKAIDIIENNGDKVTADFDIVLNSQNDTYAFSVEGTQLTRFRADIYGHASIDDLTDKESSASAEDMIMDLAKRYHIGEYADPSDTSSTFTPEKGYSKKRLLEVATIRYQLSLNSFQRYMPTTIASDVSDATVATILENTDNMNGIDIEDETVRRYTDSKYFAQILGYTGKVDSSELEDLQKENPDYDSSDIVGKSGIEKSMETQLQGKKGNETVYVDNLGNILETTNVTQPTAGNDVYLTIDKDLQEAAYDILEKKLADIILDKIRPIKEYTPGKNASSSSIVIPIYDVYYSVIKNGVLDISHFGADDAKETEKAVKATFDAYSGEVYNEIKSELSDKKTPYNKLSKEYENYETYIVQLLYTDNVLLSDKVDTSDETYIAWAKDEKISLAEFLQYAISQNWIDVSKLSMDQQYADSGKVYSALCDYIVEAIKKDNTFSRWIYKYLILNDRVTGAQICELLIEQGCVSVPDTEQAALESGQESAYTFMTNRIAKLDITPAQMNLDPYSGSMVITDPNTGEVLALVSYPSYDNNKMANGVDPDYYESLREDLSKPLLNYATQQETAPGSTFKPISATAGLMEGAINLSTTVTCTGVFTKLGEPYIHCWIYPGAHGTLNVTGGIENSCNVFFSEVGYRLSLDQNGQYDSDTGIKKLQKYATMYGLNKKTGIEIEEAAPQMSSEDAVRSAFGQGNANYTTVGLARYVSTIANGGTNYNLTLIDKVKSASGKTVKQNKAKVNGTIDMDASYWAAIKEGMRKVVQNMSFFSDLSVEVAGKTGTAQETTSRPNHALFVGFAPYDKPKIAVATRVANGYTSTYAAEITEEVLSYYFGDKTKEEIMNEENAVTSQIIGD